MIGAYRYKNTAVEAVQYDGGNFEECRDFAGAATLTRHRREEFRGADGKPASQWLLQFDHPFARQTVYPGWWLVKVAGKHMQLAMPDDRFRADYREALP